MIRSMRPAALLLACGAVLAGCGGDDATAPAPIPAEPASVPAEPAATPAPGTLDAAAVDDAPAKQSVLKAADLPPGWRGRTIPQQTDAAECAGDRRARGLRSGSVRSLKFFRGGSLIIQDVYVFPDVETAKEAFDLLTDDSADLCLGASVRPALEEELAATPARLGESRTTERRFAGVGPAGAAIRTVIPLSEPDKPEQDVVTDLATVRQGRGLVVAEATRFGRPFDAALLKRTTQATVARLERALA